MGAITRMTKIIEIPRMIGMTGDWDEEGAGMAQW